MALRLLQNGLAVVFWMVAGTIAMLVVAGPFSFFPYFGWLLGPVGALFLMLMFAQAAKRARRNRGTMVLNYVKQAVSLNLPIPPMLAAAQASEKGVLSRRLGHMCDALEEGLSVGEALQLHVPEVPARWVDLITTGERIGRLPSALDRALNEEHKVNEANNYGPMLSWKYGIVLILFLSLCLAFLGAFITPMFQEIFEDFDVAMPWQTAWTFHLMGNYSWPLCYFMVILIMMTAGWALQQALHGFEGSRRHFSWITDRMIWVTPVARSVVRDRGLADACSLISESLKAGDTLENAAYVAGELKTNVVLKQRLQRFADALKTGSSPREAADDARLPRLMVGMLATGQAISDPARVFDFLCRYYTNRFSRAALLIKSAVLPATVIMMSLVIGWVAYSMMLPLVVLIEDATLKVGTF